jgi:hypothetical protein
MLHYLNGVKPLKKAVKKISKRTKNVINKAMATPKGQKILSKTPVGRKIVKVQQLKKAGKITPKVAKEQTLKFAKAYETEAQSMELLDKMDKAVTNEIIDNINETPAPEVIKEEEAQDIQEGVNEVNEQEFNTPGSPDDETTGEDNEGNIGKVKKGKVKKIALAPVRGAFLSIVKLNGFNLANKLVILYKRNPKGLINLWQKFGGNFEALKKAVNTAKTTLWKRDKNLMIGSVWATIVSLSSTASPLLVEIIKLFKRNNIPTDEIQNQSTPVEATEKNVEDTMGYNYYI